MTPQGDTSKTLSFVVPEPVGQNRVIAVIADGDALTARLVDLTNVERQLLGGFSVVQLERRKDGKLKAPSQRALLSPMASLGEIAGLKNVVG